MEINANIIKKYREESHRNSIHHEEAGIMFKRIDNVFSVLNIAIVSISGVATSLKYDHNYDIIISCLIYFSLFLTGVQKYMNYEELSSKHGSSALGYSLLYKNIRDNMDQPSSVFITQFQVLDSISPTIPKKISEKKIDTPDDDNSSSKTKQSSSIISDIEERIELQRLRDL